jgi:hypothetical protein
VGPNGNNFFVLPNGASSDSDLIKHGILDAVHQLVPLVDRSNSFGLTLGDSGHNAKPIDTCLQVVGMLSIYELKSRIMLFRTIKVKVFIEKVVCLLVLCR